MINVSGTRAIMAEKPHKLGSKTQICITERTKASTEGINGNDYVISVSYVNDIRGNVRSNF